MTDPVRDAQPAQSPDAEGHPETPGLEEPAASPADLEPQAGAPAATTRQHPVVVYTLLRLGVLVAVGAVLYLFGLRDVWLVLFAFLVSGVISAFVLSRHREGAALGISTAVRGINERMDASARAEDDDLDDDLDDGSSGPPAP